MRSKRFSVCRALWLSGLASVTVSFSAEAGAPVKGDFNGDGFADLAIGVPFEDIGGEVNAGVVHVIYGTAGGPASGGDQLWHEGQPGVKGTLARRDRFGAALVVGDFNGDGFDDLAVGVPGAHVSEGSRTGGVHVFYGGLDGLTADEETYLLISGGAEEAGNGQGGAALAAGDFDGDGFDDLAIGMPGADVDGKEAAGRIHVFYGSGAGLGLIGLSGQVLSQASTGVASAPRPNENFGAALAAGDFDGDGFDDLAIGVPGERVAGALRAGAVHVLYGRGRGLDTRGDQFWHQNNVGVGDGAGLNDEFGTALVAGDFNGDGNDDLAIGAPLEDMGGGPGTEVDAGSVTVLYGSPAKLVSVDSQQWSQDTGGISNSPDGGDQFGAALAAGDFDGDGFDDLAIGVPFERVEGAIAGAVHIIFGSGLGLLAAGDQFWHQNQPGIRDSANDGDMFGAALGVLDFNGDGFLDLAIGVPGEKVSGQPAAGAVAVLFGSAAGITGTDNQLWTQDSPGIGDSASEGDGFGGAIGD